MSRLRKRLERQGVLPPPSPSEGYETIEYPTEGYTAPPVQQPPLVQEYDTLQQKALDYEKKLVAIEAANPHTLHQELVTKPSPKNKYPIRVMGRPIDLAKLENYVVHRISPKTITTLMRYNDVRSIEETKGYSKRTPIKLKGGLIWIIIGAMLILVIGYFLLTADISGMMRGVFGGL